MKFTSTNIGFAVAALVVLGGVAWYFSGRAPGQETPLSVTSSIPPLETRFLELTGQLNQIAFDVAVFSDPRFAALVDLATPVSTEATGRPDPFAPISSSAAAVSESGSSGSSVPPPPQEGL